MFKKLTSAFIVIAMLVSMCSFVGVFAADNLITSESFEKDLGTWGYMGTVDKTKTFFSFESDAKDGKKSLKMADNDKEYGPSVSSPRFSVTPGETYVLEADYKLVSGSLYGLAIRFINSAGKKVGDDARQKLAVGNEWKSYKVEAVAPEGASQAMVLLAGNKVNVCEIFIDNVKIYGKGKVGDVAPAPSTPAKPSTPSIAPVTGDTIFADSFENGMDLWKEFSKKNIEDCKIVSTEASDGKHSLHCVDKANDAAPAFIMKDFISVKPGETYTASCDFKLVSGNSFCLMLRFFNSAKKAVADQKATSSSTSWTNISATATAPEGAVYCAVVIPSFSKNIGEAYIDNVKLVGAKGSAQAPEVKEETKLDKINKSSIVLFIGSPNALVNGSKTLIDKSNNKVIADTVDGRTLVPVRFIAENYGAEVGWDDPTQTVTLKLKDKTVTIILNKNEIDIDGKKITIDVPAQTIQDRTMLPLRAFVEQVMGKTIFWDDRGLIVITDEAILDAAADKATIDTIIGNIK